MGTYVVQYAKAGYTSQAITGIAITNGDTTTRNVTLAFAAVNNAPVAAADSYSTVEGALLTIASPGVLANDTDADDDALTAVLVDDVNDGSLSLTPGGAFTYSPAPDFVGVDSFSYRANDGSADSDPVTVFITVTPYPVPVYRFYNFKKGVHFYTASETEKASVIVNLSGVYAYEGIAFWLGTTSSGSLPAPGLYDQPGGTTRAIGLLTYRNLEGGFWAVVNTALPEQADSASIVAVVIPSSDMEAEMPSYRNRYVSVVGIVHEGGDIYQAGPVINATSIEIVAD